jgi:hypothetical protein
MTRSLCGLLVFADGVTEMAISLFPLLNNLLDDRYASNPEKVFTRVRNKSREK